MGWSIAQDLLRRKLEGQALVAPRVGACDRAMDAVAPMHAALARGESRSELMTLEAAAALAYWESWSSVEVAFVRADRDNVPEHWRTFGKRASPLTGNSRLAGNPANALLNYLYAILEAECRIACLAVGLDPGLGVLHADQKARDSLALDIMEAVRPEVDAYVLDLLEGHVFRARDFHETRQGVCRLLPPLTQHLAGAAPMLRRSAGAVAERVARTLFQRSDGGSSRVPTPITRENHSAARDASRRRERPARVQTPKVPALCPTCGEALPLDRACLLRQVRSR